jgi:hypothetical protein
LRLLGVRRSQIGVHIGHPLESHSPIILNRNILLRMRRAYVDTVGRQKFRISSAEMTIENPLNT